MADRIVKIVLRGDVAGLKASMTAASKSVADVADRMTGSTKEAAKFRRGLTTLGDSAGKMGLVAAAGLGAIVVATANFDQAMSKVQAATHETASNMDAMRDAAIDAGAKTAFSASEAAAGIENLAKAGVTTKDILGGGLSGALDLAAAGELGVADAAEIAATAMTQFGLSGEKVPHIADLLAASAGKAQGEVSDMAMALKQSGLVASQMGLSIEETTGTLAAFASAGLLGSDAGTSFRTMLLRMANPSKEAADLMAQLGINAYDASGAFVGMESLAGQLQTAFQGQNQATRDAALATIFGSDAIRAASVLYTQGADGVTDWTNKVNDSGFAAETAAIKLDNLKGDFEEFTGSLETALIGSGSGSQGMLRGLVQGATDAVNAFNKLPPAAQGTAAALLGITAVTGGGLWFGAKVLGGIATARTAMDQLGISAVQTRGALTKVGMGLSLVAVYASLDMLFDKLNDIRGVDFENLDRGVAALADDRFTGNLQNIGEYLDRMNSGVDKFFNTTFGWAPGDTGFSIAERNVKALDEQLAALVDGGNAELAAAAMERIAAEAKKSGVSAEDTKKSFDQYNLALANSEGAADSTAGAADGLSAATDGLTDSTEANTASLQDNIDAMRENRDARLSAFNAETRYAAALDDSKKAIADNGKTLDKSTEKGRANRDALSAQAAAWNALSDRAKDTAGAHSRATAAFVDTAVAMGMSADKARALAKRLLEIKPKAVKVTADTGPAEAELRRLEALKVHDKVFSIFTNHVDTFTRHGAKPVFATGGHVSGPGTATSDSIPAYLSNGEYVVRAAAVQKYGTHMFDSLNAMRLASGGPVGYATGGPVRSVDDRLAIAQVLQQIRDLKQSLRADGDNKLGPLNRKVAELQLQVAQKELSLAKTREGRESREGGRAAGADLSFDSVLPAKPETVVGGVTAEIAEFKRAIREAGGVWTTGLTKWAATMLDRAGRLDAKKAELVAEEKARDDLVKVLGEQQAALDQLTSTMVAYSASVAGNFLKDPFNGSYTTTTPGSVDPGLASNLSSAEQQLIAIRNSATGDSVASAAMASKLIPQIAAMRAEVEKQSQPIEHTVSALDAMREKLLQSTEDAKNMATALGDLSTRLDPEMFAQLAASGDVTMAQALAGLDSGSLADINQAWSERAAAAAQVAAYATQQVYGAQQAALQAQIDNQNALIQRSLASIDRLTAQATVIGTRVENGAARGTELGLAGLKRQLDSIQSAISSIPRETAENKKKARV